MGMKQREQIPLYGRIAEQLRAEIYAVSPGTPVAPEQELVRRFGVSRGTIRQAIGMLAQEGLVVRTKGRGTFRANLSLDQDVYCINASSSRQIRSLGAKSGISELSSTLVRATAPLADLLSIPHGSQVRRVTRVRTLDGRPFVLGVAYVRADLLPKFHKDRYKTSLIDLLQDTFHLHLCERGCVCSAIAANDEDAAALQVQPGMPLLEARLTCSAVGHGPLMIDTFHFRPDYRLYLEVGKAIRPDP